MASYRTLNQGSEFTIDDEDDEGVVEIELNPRNPDDGAEAGATPQSSSKSVFGLLYLAWSTLTFSWVKPLLRLGNTRPLEQTDLYPLAYCDSAEGVYSRFRRFWSQETRKDEKDVKSAPSLVKVLCLAFGKPFFATGFLKLVHDSCLFIGPLLLNRLILLLGDPNAPVSLGYYYVLGLFCANFTMSLCLRQYFWWCFRVGMNLRSAVITSVYAKSLVICAGALSKKSTGEVTNLMSVDATRLQKLLLMAASLAGIAVIICTIPLTTQVSKYLKSLQMSMSGVRDERIKVTNEVLTGMKWVH